MYAERRLCRRVRQRLRRLSTKLLEALWTAEKVLLSTILVPVKSSNRVDLHSTDRITDRLSAYALVHMTLADMMIGVVFSTVCHKE